MIIAHKTSPQNINQNKIGLIAGNGLFPEAFIKSATSKGYDVYTVAHINETAKDSVAPLSKDVYWVHTGQFRKIIKYFTDKQINKVVFLGGITRSNLLSKIRPDLLAFKVLTKAGSLRDVPLLRAISQEFTSRGIEVVDPREFLADWQCKVGLLTKKDCTTSELRDIAIGWRAAKHSGSLDIGQTVVVAQGVIMAVEAVEGTDQAIMRGGMLHSRGGAIVVKVKKPGQDEKIDLPAVGVGTIKSMIESRCRVLAIEEDGALLLNPAEVISLADQNDITIAVYSDTTIENALIASNALNIDATKLLRKELR